MEHGVLHIYSLFQNVKKLTTLKKDEDVNLDKLMHRVAFDRNRQFFKDKYKSLWNDYANYFFTYEELKLFILYEYLFRTNVLVINISSKDVKNICKILSPEQYEKDKLFLLELNRKFGYKNIKDFFRFNEAGENVIYMLTKKKTISPMVFIKFVDEVEHNEKNEEYKRFTKLIKKIKQELTENKNGKND